MPKCRVSMQGTVWVKTWEKSVDFTMLQIVYMGEGGTNKWQKGLSMSEMDSPLILIVSFLAPRLYWCFNLLWLVGKFHVFTFYAS